MIKTLLACALAQLPVTTGVATIKTNFAQIQNNKLLVNNRNIRSDEYRMTFKDTYMYTNALLLLSSPRNTDEPIGYRKMNYWLTITTFGMLQMFAQLDKQTGDMGANAIYYLIHSSDFSPNATNFTISKVETGNKLNETGNFIVSDDTYSHDLIHSHESQARDDIFKRIAINDTSPMRVNFYYHYNAFFQDYDRITFDD